MSRKFNEFMDPLVGQPYFGTSGTNQGESDALRWLLGFQQHLLDPAANKFPNRAALASRLLFQSAINGRRDVNGSADGIQGHVPPA
jgi:hypothetical protein